MKIVSVDKSKFEGKVVIVDSCGKKADNVLQKQIVAQLGSTVFELQDLIRPKTFDIFISKNGNDYIGVNANKTYAGIIRGETDYKSVHKSLLNTVIAVAKESISEYESFMQKNV